MNEFKFSPDDLGKLRVLLGLTPDDPWPTSYVIVRTITEWKKFHDELKAQLAGD